MSEKVLCVDDEVNVLQAFQRQLRKEFDIETAIGGKEGLVAVEKRGPYAVIVSDMRMPGMDGIEFLAAVRERSPDSVRIMLTGHADLHAAIEAINKGHIFLFLTKPCTPELLANALKAGIRQYQLIRAEKELLENTLSGSIKVLTEVLALVNPTAFGQSSRIARYATGIAEQLKLADMWQVKTAALLSQIGCVIVPETVLAKRYRRQSLTAEEEQLFNQHPLIARDLLGKIPRMGPVAESIAYQEKRFDGSGIPRDSRKGEGIPLGARILKVALDYDALETAGLPRERALEQLEQRPGWYDPAVIAAFKAAFADEIRYEIRTLTVHELEPGMILAEEVEGITGILLIAKGQEVTASMVTRLRNYAKSNGLKEPIKVLIPLHAASTGGASPHAQALVHAPSPEASL